MRIAIHGAGGVGGYFGGRLAQAGHSVVFLARGAHLDALCKNGLRVESPAGDFVLGSVDATDTPAKAGIVDAVLVCVKAWQIPEAAAAIPPMLGPESFVVPLQNGVEAADEIGEVVGASRVLGGLCRIISYYVAPGHIRHSGVAPCLEVGDRGDRRTDRPERLRSAFASAIGVDVVVREDIETAIWEKFLFIAPFSGVGAVTRMPAGVIRRVAESRAMLTEAMAEIAAVAIARGIALDRETVARTMAFADALPEGATASMQRDILAGRPSELESITGAVVRLARDAGVPVPVNLGIYRSLLPAERCARGA